MGGEGWRRKKLSMSLTLPGRQMFERDASLALSDARFLTEGKRSYLPYQETITKFQHNYITTYSCYDLQQSQCIICTFAASAVAEVDQKEVEVDESLFQDFEDLEMMEDTQT